MHLTFRSAMKLSVEVLQRSAIFIAAAESHGEHAQQ